MKLGLLGYPIEHSLSPSLYKKFLGEKLTSYELFSCPQDVDIPTLKDFASRLDGLNITSPYKRHFVTQVEISDPLVKNFGAINTIAFGKSGIKGTNTDLLAVREILTRLEETYSRIALILLGDGVMANLTKLLAQEKNLQLQQYARKTHQHLDLLNLAELQDKNTQTIVINACSRDFVFRGKTSGLEIFWDYNYQFAPHASTLPSKVFQYDDGREMLELQAQAAIQFWQTNL